MFEREQFRDEFHALLDHGRASMESIEHLLKDESSEPVRVKLEELHEHAQRHVNMLERLLEIVD